jgi:hypothetical protein
MERIEASYTAYLGISLPDLIFVEFVNVLDVTDGLGQ